MHDAGYVQILRLLVTDTYRWKCDWAAWRMRFDYDEHADGMRLSQVGALIREQALPHCTYGAEAHANILYLREEQDMPMVFAQFRTITHGLGHISSIQSRASYEDATRVATLLARGIRKPSDPTDDALELPDMQWHVTGTHQHRVAHTRVRGRDVAVRFGYLGGQEMWVIDIDDKQNCAHFRTRADALSKLGVGVALETAGHAKR